jgi:hypothetical protein
MTGGGVEQGAVPNGPLALTTTTGGLRSVVLMPISHLPKVLLPLKNITAPVKGLGYDAESVLQRTQGADCCVAHTHADFCASFVVVWSSPGF